jgi:hypothetical protein
MSSEKKKDKVVIVNRPTDREGSHTASEWASYQLLREQQETLADIRKTRNALGEFTLRFVSEAIYGEKITHQLYGDDPSADIKIRDMVIDEETWRNLSKVGGEKSRKVAEKINSNNKTTSSNTVNKTQVELLKALLKTMDPEVVRKALLD